MKKAIIYLLVITLMLSVCSCSTNKYNLEVTAEPFESMEIRNSLSSHETYETEEDLYDNVDFVFIGMPTQTFTDGKTLYYDLDGAPTTKDSGKVIGSVYTTRDVQVLEVIKGDITEKKITVAERGAVSEDESGKTNIVGVPSSNFIAKKNAKYIYYANYDESKGFYLAHMDNGKVNVDSLDQNGIKAVSKKRLEQVKERFSAQFEHYDRSVELKNK